MGTNPSNPSFLIRQRFHARRGKPRRPEATVSGQHPVYKAAATQRSRALSLTPGQSIGAETSPSLSVTKGYKPQEK